MTSRIVHENIPAEMLKNTGKQRRQITSKNINHILSYCQEKKNKIVKQKPNLPQLARTDDK